MLPTSYNDQQWRSFLQVRKLGKFFLSIGATAPKRTASFCLAGILFGCCLQGLGESSQEVFVPFDNFVEHTKTAKLADFQQLADSKVKDSSAFEEMRQSILSRYRGIDVSHSFLVDGNHYDCVRADQQPAMKKFNLKTIAVAPPQSLLHGEAPTEANGVDAVGNSTVCEANRVPLLRTTLEAMSRFATLQDYYRKIPGGAVHAAQLRGAADPEVAAHKYSIVYQYVDDLGGNSNLNVWSPHVNTSEGEIFSLSQEWYVGGSGSGTQTEEVGWVVYPQMFNGDQRARFFIYSTADDYQTTGCWNNTCGDFVQTTSSSPIAKTFGKYSSYGGIQSEFSAQYYLYQGNWWLSYQGSWIGYYPGAKYNGGQNTRYAQLLEFGTESVGTTIWPPEGSGQWAATQWSHAAYQRNLTYYALDGTSTLDTLTPFLPSPTCYSISGPYHGHSTGWHLYFYEGGPGGTGC